MKFKEFEIIPTNENSLDEEHLENIISTIEYIKLNQQELGKGRAAAVIVFPNKEYCVKAVFDKSLEFSYNDIYMEHEMQEEARDAGVRTPKVIASAVSESKDPYLIMEEIDGFSLRAIIDGNKKLPDGFDEEKFWKDLDLEIKKLHDAKIYHRDLHAGNIMIDYETCLPVIIDYGHAKHKYGQEDIYLEENYPLPNEHTKFKSDEVRAKEAQIELRDHLTKKL